MTDKPILFNGPMVRAILEGRKTQTRRIQERDVSLAGAVDNSFGRPIAIDAAAFDRRWPVRTKYVKGDRLWVRETWQAHSWASDCVTIRYQASVKTEGFTGQIEQIKYPNGDKNSFRFYAPTGPYKWRPSIHMPRWASRLTLIVEDVRVKRLQDITEADARAEGAKPWTGAEQSYVTDFARIWRDAYGPEAWDANPWVAAITFRTIRANIDSPEART